MIVGLGIDVVETDRIKAALERHGARFESKVLTGNEIAECRDRADRIQAVAGRFAAKEACLKALGTGWAQGLGFRQVEVVRDTAGRPTLRLEGAAAARAALLGVRGFHVSLTHDRGIAAAVVVLEG